MAARAPLDEPSSKCPAAVDDTAEVDVEHPLPLIGGGVEELACLANARVVHHDVGHAVLGAHLLGEPFDGFGVGHIEHVGVRSPAALDDHRGGVLDGGLVDIADDELGALARECQRGLPADAAARAGDRHQRVAEGLALAADLRPQQRPARGLALEVVDQLVDAAASTCGCDIGDQWPALMSRRHSRGTHRDRSSNPCGRTTGSFAPTTSCTGTLT